MPLFMDLTGQCFHYWVVLRRAANLGKQTAWHCQCACGTLSVVRSDHLREGRVRSCGCQRNVTHGASFKSNVTPEYKALANARTRCKPGNKNHLDYFDRGITVSPEWDCAGGFVAFLAHIGLRPSNEHSLDRIDNDRGYWPGNVRWATKTEQMQNTRWCAPLLVEIHRLHDVLDAAGLPY